MPWTNKQKAIAARVCEATRPQIDRKLLLRQFPNAMFDAEGKRAPDPTSTSKRLNQSDFEHFMEFVERCSGGQVKIAGANGESWPAGYWARKAADDLARMRHIATRIDGSLQCEVDSWKKDGAGLRGWIHSRVAEGKTLEQLTYEELRDLINGLKAFARRHAVELSPC